MLRDIGIVMLCVGVVLLAISLILIFALKIPDLLDELSGRKAKRQIKRLKELNMGTGSLDGMATDDVYLALSSGSLVSEEIKMKSNESIEDDDESSDTGDVKNVSSEKGTVSSGSPVSIDEEEKTPVARVISVEEEEPSSDIPDDEEGDEEEPTNFVDEDEDSSTSYVSEGEVTGMLSDVQEYVSNKKFIEIVEEQSSIL